MKSFASASIVAFVAAACGGTTEPQETATIDIADPRFLPSGSYTLTMGDASCNVNSAFQEGRTVLLMRAPHGEPAAINAPLPMPTATGGVGLLRQDLPLDGEPWSYTAEDPGCAGGAITRAVEITQRTATRLALAYTEERTGCVTESEPATCSVEYAFDLLEAACPETCIALSVKVSLTPSGEARWTCTCK